MNSDEPNLTSEDTASEREQHLCLNCVEPNDPGAHFCSKCGAPMSSFAATAPFERLFAEGHVYRKAVSEPRSLFVVIGIWLVFGSILFLGLNALVHGYSEGIHVILVSVFAIAISLAIIFKTTRNYFAYRSASRD